MPNPEQQKSPEMEEAIDKLEKETFERTRFTKEIEKTTQEISQRDEILEKFVKKESQGLEPYAKETIDFFVPLAKTFEREMQRREPYDKKGLIIAAGNLADTLAQAEEKFAKLFKYEKYEPYKNRFESLKLEAEAVFEDAKVVEKKRGEFSSGNPREILSQEVAFKYRALRDLTRDIYQASLIKRGDPRYYDLPDQIVKKIREIEVKKTQAK